MRVAFATDDQIHLAAHTGRCGGFMVYSFVGRAWTDEGFRPNPMGGCGHNHSLHDPEREHGRGHHTHDAMVTVLKDCQGLVTKGLGPRLAADLAARNITVYVTNSPTVQDAATLLAAGKLPVAAGFGDCTHV